MEKISEEEIKNLFAEWGLWSLVEDISDDGDGTGDTLQLTKEGLEAHRMIDLLIWEKEIEAREYQLEKLLSMEKDRKDWYLSGSLKYVSSKHIEEELSKLNKKKYETINES